MTFISPARKPRGLIRSLSTSVLRCHALMWDGVTPTLRSNSSQRSGPGRDSAGRSSPSSANLWSLFGEQVLGPDERGGATSHLPPPPNCMLGTVQTVQYTYRSPDRRHTRTRRSSCRSEKRDSSLQRTLPVAPCFTPFHALPNDSRLPNVS